MYRYFSFLRRLVSIIVPTRATGALLRGSTDVGERANDTCGVECRARQDGWAQEEQGAQRRSLACVEALGHMSNRNDTVRIKSLTSQKVCFRTLFSGGV